MLYAMFVVANAQIRDAENCSEYAQSKKMNKCYGKINR